MKLSEKTFAFLQNLSVNNNREWFQHNKTEYETARTEFIHFSQTILEGLSKIDSRIPGDYPISKCIFRIYRDVRFSKDKTPYKTFFSAAFSSIGKQTQVPGYYLQMEPGKSFLAIGIWQPDRDKLHAIRQEIDYNGGRLRDILEDQKFRNNLSLHREDRLKKAPKGYLSDHPDIELLRLKSFMALREFSDKEIHSVDADQLIIEACLAAGSFLDFLYEALDDVNF